MAFTTTLIGKSGNLLNAFNIDWSVGIIGSNMRADVMLVQALLKILNYEMAGSNDGLDPPPGEPNVIVVDGLIGPITQRHITHFQQQAAERGQVVTVDGIFDPYRAAGASSTVSETRYALDLLNNCCANSCTQQGADNYANLPNRDDMPQLLCSALKQVKKTADKYTFRQLQQWEVPSTGGA